MKSIDTIADELIKLFFTSFGGKDGGRYFLSRNDFLDLCNRTYLRQDFLDELQDRIAIKEFILIDVGKGFALFQLSTICAFRKVPKKLIGG